MGPKRTFKPYRLKGQKGWKASFYHPLLKRGVVRGLGTDVESVASEICADLRLICETPFSKVTSLSQLTREDLDFLEQRNRQAITIYFGKESKITHAILNAKEGIGSDLMKHNLLHQLMLSEYAAEERFASFRLLISGIKPKKSANTTQANQFLMQHLENLEGLYRDIKEVIERLKRGSFSGSETGYVLVWNHADYAATVVKSWEEKNSLLDLPEKFSQAHLRGLRALQHTLRTCAEIIGRTR